MLSHQHMGAPLFHSTGKVCPWFWNSGSLMEWKWCHCTMVEADIHLRLLPTSILDMYKVFEVLVCWLRSIWVHLYLFTSQVGHRFWNFIICGWETIQLQHGWGLHPPQTASHIHIRQRKMFKSLVCCLKGIWVHPYILPPAKLAPDFGILGPLWSENGMVEDDIHLRLLPTSILDIHRVFEVLVWA